MKMRCSMNQTITNLMLIAILMLCLCFLFALDNAEAEKLSKKGYCGGEVDSVMDIPSLHAVCKGGELEVVR